MKMDIELAEYLKIVAESELKKSIDNSRVIFRLPFWASFKRKSLIKEVHKSLGKVELIEQIYKQAKLK